MASLSGTGSKHHTRGDLAGPCAHAGGAAAVGTGEAGAVYQGAVVTSAAGGVSTPAEAVLGQHLWGRGYFCATVGAVDEKTIVEYIESQKWDQDEQGFKITAPEEP